jgi:predicted Zn-dependent peptidase
MNRLQAPAIKDATEFNLTLKPYQKFILDNGVEIIYVEAGAQDVLMVEWVFDAGNWYDEQKQIASTTNFLLKNGTSRKSAFELNEEVEYYGSFLNRNCYNETATITLHAPTKQLNHLLPVVREMITDAVFPEEELAIYVTNTKQKLQVNLKKCEYVAGQLIDAYVYGEKHPYGVYSKPEDFDSLQREQLVRFYEQYYQKGHCIIFAAGKLPADFTSTMNSLFGDLPIKPRVPVTKTHLRRPAAEKKHRIINDPEGVQGAIRLARSFPDRNNPDFQKFLVLNTLFGGFFGSRLMSNIREDKGYTYGIGSGLGNLIRGGFFFISTEVGVDVTQKTLDEIYKELALLREELIGEDELELIRNYMLGQFLRTVEGPFSLADKFKLIWEFGLSYDYFDNYFNQVKTVQPTELNQLAKSYFQEKDMIECVVGKK